MKEIAFFWTKVEESLRFGGPRRYLRELLGDDLEAALEKAGLLVQRRVDFRYPCPSWRSASCPRIVEFRTGGELVALCAMLPAQCAKLDLTAKDIDVLAVVPRDLVGAVAGALKIRPNVEELSGIRGCYRVGTFMPEPGVRHAVYLLARWHESEYREAVDALRTHNDGQTFAVLLPTEQLISDTLRRQARAAGVPLISLADSVGLGDDGRLCALVDPLRLFADIGRPPGGTAIVSAAATRSTATTVSGVSGASTESTAAGVASVSTVSTAPTVSTAVEYVALALIRDDDGPAVWRHLDRAGYQHFASNAAAYDVFGDEFTKTVTKERGRIRITDVPAWQFNRIRFALEKRRRYDPGISDDDGAATKQQFQRARRMFDLKNSDGWGVFQTERVDQHAVYSLAPGASVRFAFVFIADGSDDEHARLELA